MATQDTYAAAIAYATAEGTRAGQNAAEWWLHLSLAAARSGYPPTGHNRRPCDWRRAALRAAYGWQMGDDAADYHAWFSDICDAYENAYRMAAESVIATAAREAAE